MHCLRSWRRWIRPLVILSYILLLTIALPLCIWDLNRVHKAVHVQAWFVGGLFVMMSLPISLWGILQHLVYYTQPVLQRHIIRILWMVPIYAANAWFALRFPSAAIYLDTVRECYEAYVIYNFTSYLMHYLRTEHPHFDIVLEGKPQVKHLIPFCLLPPWPMGRSFIQRCKHGVLQYTVVRPGTTVIALICELAGKYDEGDFNFTSAWSYLVIINNISQIWAMYCLILFYKAAKEELAAIRPLPKFLCVKAVVFMSFWQAVVIAALDKMGAIPHQDQWIIYKSDKEVATGIQDFCICIEMFIAAIAHYYSFSHKPFMDMAADQTNCCQSFMSMWDVRDVRDDMIEHARYLGKGMHNRLLRRRNDNSERAPLLGEVQSRGNSINSHTDVTRTHTPPLVVNVEDVQTSRPDWDVSSIDQIHDAFVNKSTTASMNNYLEFSSSVNISDSKHLDIVGVEHSNLGGGDLNRAKCDVLVHNMPPQLLNFTDDNEEELMLAHSGEDQFMTIKDSIHDSSVLPCIPVEESEKFLTLNDSTGEISPCLLTGESETLNDSTGEMSAHLTAGQSETVSTCKDSTSVPAQSKTDSVIGKDSEDGEKSDDIPDINVKSELDTDISVENV